MSAWLGALGGIVASVLAAAAWWLWGRFRRSPLPIRLPPAPEPQTSARRLLEETDRERELRQRDLVASHAAIDARLDSEVRIEAPTEADLDRSIARAEELAERHRRPR